MQKKTAKEKLQEAWNENPLVVIGVATAAAMAAAKVLDSLTAARNSRSWSKEVNRRTRNQARRYN